MKKRMIISKEMVTFAELNKQSTMKRIVLTLVALLGMVSAWSQTDEISKEQADKLNAITLKLMEQKRYDDAIKAKERELVILKSLYGETDSTYIKQFAFSAKLYYRNEQAAEAASVIEKAANLYATHVSNNDAMYAYYLDNLSLYQLSTKDCAKAAENCRKALTIYEKLGRNDYDLAIILMHMAEASHDIDQTSEAIKYEIRSLNLIKKICGEHSDEYIDELPYLHKYYTAVNDEKNAKQVEDKITRLKKEKEDGIVDLPEPIIFKSAEECHEHNGDAFKCIKYYLTHKVSASQIDQAARYILNWSEASNDVTIYIGKEMAPLASEKNPAYLVAYIASCSYVCLTENMKELDEEHFIQAIDILLQFYKPNSQLTGKVELLENYLKLQEKGKLEKALRKVFAEEKKQP